MGTDVDSVTHPVPGAGTPPDLLGRWWELVDAAPAVDSVRYLDDRGAELVEQRRSRGELADLSWTSLVPRWQGGDDRGAGVVEGCA
ncbi:hypothetical protein ACH0BZ_15520, partial [Dietzia sp. 179-F 9C3 NHS]